MTDITTRLAELKAVAERDVWCHREDCQWPHSHRRGDDCPDGAPPRQWSTEDALALIAALEGVVAVHRPVTTQVTTGDCAAEECDHEDDNQCPRVDFVYCMACDSLCEQANPYYSEGGMGLSEWPCPTVQAITDALGVNDA